MMLRVALLSVVVLGSTCPLCADDKGGFQLSPKFYLAPDRFLLLKRRYASEELQLTEEEKLKVGRAKSEVARRRSIELYALRKVKDDKLIAAYYAALIKVARETDRQLKAALPAEKYKRLNAVTMQTRGTRAFFDPDVQKALKITKSQKTALGEIQDEAIVADGKLRLDVRRKKLPREDYYKQQRQIDKRARKQILRKLTAPQRKQYKSMLGKLLRPNPPTLTILIPTSNYVDVPRDLYRRLKEVRRRRR